MQFVERCIAQFAFLLKQKRVLIFSFITSKKYLHFSSWMGGWSTTQHSRQSSTGLQLHPPIQPPTNAHTYTQTHLEHKVCARCNLEVAGLHFCSAFITSASCFATSCAEVPYRNLHAPGLSRWFLSHVAFGPASSGSAGSCTPQLS